MLSPSFAILAFCWLLLAVGGLSLGIMADINQASAPAFPLLPVLISQSILNVGAVVLTKFIGVTQIEGYRWYMPFCGGQSFVILTAVSLTIIVCGTIGNMAYFFATYYINILYGLLSVHSLAIFAADCMHVFGLLLFEKNSPKEWSWLNRLSSSPNRETAIVGLITGCIIAVSLIAELVGSVRVLFSFVCLVLHVGCGIAVHGIIGWKMTPNYRLFMPFPSKKIISSRNFAQFGIWLLWTLMLQAFMALLLIPPTEAPPYVYIMSGLTSALSIVSLLVFVRTFSAAPPHSTSLLANNGSQVLTACAFLLAAEIVIAGAIAERPEWLPFGQDTLVEAPFLQSKLQPQFADGATSASAERTTTTIAGAIFSTLSGFLVLSPEANVLKFTEGTLAAIDASQQICAAFLIAIPPATHLIGSLIHGPSYNTFQPFRGSAIFVSLQGLGWALYSFALFFLVLSLAINREDEVHRLWLAAFAYTMVGAQMVLQASVKAFSDGSAPSDTKAMGDAQADFDEEDKEDSMEVSGKITEEWDRESETADEEGPEDLKRKKFLLARRRRVANEMKQAESFLSPDSTTVPPSIPSASPKRAAVPPAVRKQNQVQRFFNGEMIVAIIFAITGFIMRFVCDNLVANGIVAAAVAATNELRTKGDATQPAASLGFSEHIKATVPAILIISTGFLAVATPAAHIAHRKAFAKAGMRWGSEGGNGRGSGIQGFVTGVMQGPKEATALQTVGWSIYAVMLVVMLASSFEPLSLEPQFLPYTLEAIASLVPFFFVSMSMYVLLNAAEVRQTVRREAILDLKLILNSVIPDPMARNEVGNRIDWLLQIVTGSEGLGSFDDAEGHDGELDEDGNPVVSMRFGGEVLFETHHESRQETGSSAFDSERRRSGSESDDENGGTGLATDTSEVPSPQPGEVHPTHSNKPLAQTFASLSSSIGALGASRAASPIEATPTDPPVEADALKMNPAATYNAAALGSMSSSPAYYPNTDPLAKTYPRSNLSGSFNSSLSASLNKQGGVIKHNTSAALLVSQMIGFTLLAFIMALVQKGKSHPFIFFAKNSATNADISTILNATAVNATLASTSGMWSTFISQPRNEILTTLFALGGTILMTINALATQGVYGPFIHGAAFRFAMPFRGGFSFVVLQSIGWGLFSASWLLFLLHAMGMAQGATPIVMGCFVSIAAQVTIFVSIPYFRTRTKPSTFVEENAEAVIAILTFVVAFSLMRSAETVVGNRASAVSILISTVALCIALPLAAVALRKSADAYGKRQSLNDLEEEEQPIDLNNITMKVPANDGEFTSPAFDVFSPSPSSAAASPGAMMSSQGERQTNLHPKYPNFRRTDETSIGPASINTETATYVSSHYTREGSAVFDVDENNNSSARVSEKAPKTKNLEKVKILKSAPPIAHMRKTPSLMLEAQQNAALSPPLLALEYTALVVVAQFPLMIMFLLYYYLNNFYAEVSRILSAGWVAMGVFTSIIFVVVFSRTRHYQAAMDAFRTYCLFCIPIFIVGAGFALPVLLPSFGTWAMAVTIIVLTFFPGKWRIFVSMIHWVLLAIVCCFHGNKAFHFVTAQLSVHRVPGVGYYEANLEPFDAFLVFFCDALSGIAALLRDALPLIVCSWYGQFLKGRPDIDGSQYRPRGLRLCYAELFSYAERFFDVRVLADDIEAAKKAQRVRVHQTRRVSINTPLIKKDPKTPLTTTTMSGGAIIGFHPHGVFPITVLWLHFTRRWERMFSGCPRVVSCGASIVFQTPILRDIAMTVGTRVVTKAAIEKVMAEGMTPLIVPGGQAEMICSIVSDKEMHIVTYHVGFIRLAMTHKRAAIPLISFGEQDILGNVYLPKLQAFFLKKVGFGFPVLPLGKWNLPLPFRTPLRIAVGKPVYPDAGEDDPTNPTHVAKMADKYFAELREIFYKYREEAGYPHMELYYHSDKKDVLKSEIQTPDSKDDSPLDDGGESEEASGSPPPNSE